MPLPRSSLVSLADTPYYHIVSRCVRRAFLCGEDKVSGKSYEHRRQWVEDRIRVLSSLFAIDICAYAVMSNHLHIVVKLCPEQLDGLSNKEILRRWTCLYKGTFLAQRAMKGQTLDKVQQQILEETCAVYRDRLASLSWFMRCLNEPIARKANEEDGCTGHFWESRFKSQALLSEEALLSCMTYVDLNPVRAGMAQTPEDSEHTSIKERIKPAFNKDKAIKEHLNQDLYDVLPTNIKPLARFEGCTRKEEQHGILFTLQDYLELVDETGRIIRDDKRGFIPNTLPPILQRLNIDQGQWLEQCTQFEALYEKRFRRKRRSNTASTA